VSIRERAITFKDKAHFSAAEYRNLSGERAASGWTLLAIASLIVNRKSGQKKSCFACFHKPRPSHYLQFQCKPAQCTVKSPHKIISHFHFQSLEAEEQTHSLDYKGSSAAAGDPLQFLSPLSQASTSKNTVTLPS